MVTAISKLRMTVNGSRGMPTCFPLWAPEARLRIMQLLLSAHPEGLVVSEIQDDLEIPSSTLSHHLEKLKNEDLVRVERQGTFCVIRQTRRRSAKYCNFFMPSVVRATRRSSRRISFNCADRRISMADTDIKDVVKEKYGQAALLVTNRTGGSSCCGAAPATGFSCDPITSNLYDATQVQQIPEQAMLA